MCLRRLGDNSGAASSHNKLKLHKSHISNLNEDSLPLLLNNVIHLINEGKSCKDQIVTMMYSVILLRDTPPLSNSVQLV